MEPTSSSQLFYFPPLDKPGAFTPIKPTPEQGEFFDDVFGKGIQIIDYVTSKFSDSYYTCIRAVLEYLHGREEGLNKFYQVQLQDVQGKFRATLGTRDPDWELKVKVRMLWEAQHLVDGEAGRSTEVRLMQTKGGKTEFTPYRAIRFIIEKEPEEEQEKVLEVIHALKLSDGEIAKLEEDVQCRLQQMTIPSLRSAFFGRVKKGFALQNKIPLEKFMSKADFPQPVLIQPDNVTEISCLVFRTLQEIPEQEFKGKIDLQIASRIAQIHLSIDLFGLLFFTAEDMRKRGSSRLVLPEELLRGLQEWLCKFSTPIPQKEEESAAEKGVRLLKSIFLSNSDKNIAVNPSLASKKFQRPQFSRSSGGPWIPFFRAWVDLRKCFEQLKELLLEKKKKISVPNMDPTFTGDTGKVQKEGSSYIQRKSPQNPKRIAIGDIVALLEQLINLMDIVAGEIEPVASPITTPLIARHATPMVQDSNFPKGRLYELVSIFERFVLWQLEIREQNSSPMIWNHYFAHLDQVEQEQNKIILEELNRTMETFHKTNHSTQPEMHRTQWAERHFEKQLELGKKYHPSTGLYTLPLVQDNLTDLVARRLFVRYLNRSQETRKKYPTVGHFEKALRAITLVEAIQIHAGHDTIKSLHDSVEANVINHMLRWLNDERKRIQKKTSLNSFVESKHAEIFEKLSQFDLDLLVINALLDAFVFIQTIRKSSLFPETLRSVVLKATNMSITELTHRLKELQRDLNIDRKKNKPLGTREASYSDTDLRAPKQTLEQELGQLKLISRQLSSLLKTLEGRDKAQKREKGSPRFDEVRENIALCSELITVAAKNAFQLPGAPRSIG